MCGIQSVEHLKSILKIIKEERDKSVPQGQAWPAKHMQQSVAAPNSGGNAPYGLYGSSQNEGRKFRIATAKRLRKMFQEQCPHLQLPAQTINVE